jgi:hypothetical protein
MWSNIYPPALSEFDVASEYSLKKDYVIIQRALLS